MTSRIAVGSRARHRAASSASRYRRLAQKLKRVMDVEPVGGEFEEG